METTATETFKAGTPVCCQHSDLPGLRPELPRVRCQADLVPSRTRIVLPPLLSSYKNAAVRRIVSPFSSVGDFNVYCPLCGTLDRMQELNTTSDQSCAGRRWLKRLLLHEFLTFEAPAGTVINATM